MLVMYKRMKSEKHQKSKKDLKSQIILPPFAQQQKFLRLIRQIKKSKLTIQQSLDKLEILKKL